MIRRGGRHPQRERPAARGDASGAVTRMGSRALERAVTTLLGRERDPLCFHPTQGVTRIRDDDTAKRRRPPRVPVPCTTSHEQEMG